jgi:thiamine pyrophosphokinase
MATRSATPVSRDGIVIVGALGGPRLDHALANVGLPALGALAETPVVILTDVARVGWLRAPRVDGGPARWPLVGRVGDLVSLLPMGVGVDGVTTDGLVYPLHDEPLSAGSTRGLSNVIASPGAAVTLRSGMLLIVESPATLPP